MFISTNQLHLTNLVFVFLLKCRAAQEEELVLIWCIWFNMSVLQQLVKDSPLPSSMQPLCGRACACHGEGCEGEKEEEPPVVLISQIHG